MHDDRPPGAGLDAGSHVEAVAALREHGSGVECARALLGRKSFTGQSALICRETARRQEIAVRRDEIADPEYNHIAADEILGRDFLFPAVPAHGHLVADHFEKLFDRDARAILLEKAEHRRKEHNRKDNQSVRRILHQKRNRGCKEQEQRDRALELPEEYPERTVAVPLGQAVFAVGPEPFFRFRRRESRCSGRESREHFVCL